MNQRTIKTAIKFNDSNIQLVLQSLFLQSMSMVETLEGLLQMTGSKQVIRVDNKPLDLRILCNKSKGLITELENISKRFDKYWQEGGSTQDFQDAVDNYTHMFKLMATLTPESRSVLGAMLILHQENKPAFNTLTTNLIKTPIDV